MSIEEYRALALNALQKMSAVTGLARLNGIVDFLFRWQKFADDEKEKAASAVEALMNEAFDQFESSLTVPLSGPDSTKLNDIISGLFAIATFTQYPCLMGTFNNRITHMLNLSRLLTFEPTTTH